MNNYIDKTNISTINEFVTADGSTIRELMHPDNNRNVNQSLAEATVASGCTTHLHKHVLSEELYHITQGSGEMTLGVKKFTVVVGDTVCISPGTAHKIRNVGVDELKILCCCSPCYSHADTILL